MDVIAHKGKKSTIKPMQACYKIYLRFRWMAVNNVPVIGAISLKEQGIRLSFCWFYSLFFMFQYSLYLAVMLWFPCPDIIEIRSSHSRLCSLFSRLASACVMNSVKLCFASFHTIKCVELSSKMRHFTLCFAVFYTMKWRKPFHL